MAAERESLLPDEVEVWHGRSTHETLNLLATSRAGLTRDEVAQRRARYGPNELEAQASRSIGSMLLSQFTDFTILILIGAAIISGLVGDIIDTLVIAAIVFLNGIIGCVQEIRSETAMAALRAMSAPTATVVRAGNQE